MKDQDIFFSFIIPTFNRRDLIAQCILSILQQTDSRTEIIVIDDGSDDDTESVFAEMKLPVVYRKTPNRERGAARNTGLMMAKGQYVNYFDSDDIFLTDLRTLREWIEGQNYPPVVYGSIVELSNDGKLGKPGPKPYQNFKENILFNNFLACGSVFVSRAIAMTFPFSEDRALSGTEDWELWLRLYAKYDFVDSGLPVFAQRNHDLRSLRNMTAAQITIREMAFLNHISVQYQSLVERFAPAEINRLRADRYTLIALAHCADYQRGMAFKYLRLAIGCSNRVILRKRFWAVAKNLMSPFL